MPSPKSAAYRCMRLLRGPFLILAKLHGGFFLLVFAVTGGLNLFGDNHFPWSMVALYGVFGCGIFVVVEYYDQVMARLMHDLAETPVEPTRQDSEAYLASRREQA